METNRFQTDISRKHAARRLLPSPREGSSTKEQPVQGTTSIDQRVIQYRARFAMIEVLVELLAAGSRAVARWLEAIAENQRRAQACHHLHGLSDHYLKDIGIERRHIDRMFR